MSVCDYVVLRMDSNLKETTQETAKWTFVQTISSVLLLCGEISNGIAYSMIGPSLLDLAGQTATSVSRVSWYLSVDGIGAIVGILLMGKTMTLRGWWLQLALMHCLGGLIFAALPWITVYGAAVACFFCHGFCHGFCSTGSTVSFLRIWPEKDARSWVAAGLLCLIVGKFLGPLLLAPFLVPSESYLTVENITSNSSLLQVNEADVKTDFMYAYAISGGISVVLAGSFILLYVCKASPDFQQTEDTSRSKATKIPKDRKGKCVLGFICGLLILFYCLVIIFSSNYGTFIPTYSVERLGLSKQIGAYSSAAYNFSKSISRFVGIFIVRVAPSKHIIFVSLSIVSVGFIIFAALVDIWSSVLWLGTLLVGFGNGNITPSGVAWSNNTFGGGLVGVIFGIGFRAGEIFGPILIGYLFDYVSYDAFLYAMLVLSLACVLIMLTLVKLGSYYTSLKDDATDKETQSLLGEDKSAA